MRRRSAGAAVGRAATGQWTIPLRRWSGRVGAGEASLGINGLRRQRRPQRTSMRPGVRWDHDGSERREDTMASPVEFMLTDLREKYEAVPSSRAFDRLYDDPEWG